MKYWNKDKNTRVRCWTKISLLGNFHKTKFWLQQQPGGKFYIDEFVGPDYPRRLVLHQFIWFQREKDATMFLLSYDNIPK